MLKKYFVLAGLLLVSILTNAQESKQAFDKAVDYCNCQLTFAYLKALTETKPQKDPDKVAFEKIKLKFGDCDAQNPLDYSTLSNLLDHNNFKRTNQNFSSVVNQVKSKYSESLSKKEAVSEIMDGVYSNAALNDFYSKFSVINEQKEPLTTNISKLLGNTFSNQKEAEPTMDYAAEINDLKIKIETNEPRLFTPNWLSIILIVALSMAVFIILKLKLSDLEKRIKEYRDEFNQDSDSSKASIKKAETSASTLHAEIAKLKNDFDNLAQNIQRQQLLNSSAIAQTVQDEQQQVLYAPIPNSKGAFNASAVVPTKDQISTSFYKFTITDRNPIKASFEFLNAERTVMDAKSSPELILNPVCKIKNALNQNAKRIQTVKHGIVEKQNDKWVLVQPAEIEYE